MWVQYMAISGYLHYMVFGGYSIWWSVVAGIVYDGWRVQYVKFGGYSMLWLLGTVFGGWEVQNIGLFGE